MGARWRMDGGTDAAMLDDEEVRTRLAVARQAHGDLDSAVEALGRRDVPDQLQLARMKRQKLKLRDEIAWLEERLVPDIIA